MPPFDSHKTKIKTRDFIEAEGEGGGGRIDLIMLGFNKTFHMQN